LSVSLAPVDLKVEEAIYPQLKIYSLSSHATVLIIRGYTENAIINAIHTTNSDRSAATSTISIDSLPIELFVGISSGTPLRGQCWVVVNLLMGGVDVATLIQGYIAPFRNLTFPRGNIEDMHVGPGHFHFVLGTDPAANAEILETVPTNAVWRLHAMWLQLVTDATAANRYVTIFLDDGTYPFYQVTGPVHTASLTQSLVLSSGFAFPDVTGIVQVFNAIGIAHLPLPVGMLLSETYRIRTVTTNIQATDNYVAPRLLVEELIQG